MLKKIIYNILMLNLSLAFIGCSDFLEPEMKGATNIDMLLSTEKGIQTAMNGVYEPLIGLYKSNMSVLTDQASDDGWTWRFEQNVDLFIMSPEHQTISSVWKGHFDGIGRANVVLDNLINIKDFKDEKTRNYIEGQAKFMRAFYYFNLVRLFGGVPILEHSIKTIDDTQIPRSSIQEVYVFIKTNLDEAEKLLPEEFSGDANFENGRPTKYTVNALKALVHLELGEWEQVVASTDKIIGKGELLKDYAKNFNGTAENGNQSLFEVQYGGVTTSTTTGISSFYAPTAAPYSGGSNILPTDDSFEGTGGGITTGNGFVQLFDDRPEDNRKNVILSTYGLPNFIDANKPDGSLYFVNKYYNSVDPRGKSTWNFPLIRYAEILLAKAEALNELKYESNGEALNLVNMIRENAGLSKLLGTEYTTQETFREYIMKERRIELAFECKRFFDLNRRGILQSAIQLQMDYMGVKFPENKLITHPITKKRYYLYPIPSTEFVNNALLGEQNPGY